LQLLLVFVEIGLQSRDYACLLALCLQVILGIDIFGHGSRHAADNFEGKSRKSKVAV